MLIARLAALSVLLLGASDSEVTPSLVAPDLAPQLETVHGCCQHQDPDASALLDVAETWRLDSGESSFASDFGLGDDQGLRCGRFELDMGVPAVTSLSTSEAEGSGDPLSGVGASFDPDFELSDDEASSAFDFDFHLEVTQVNGLASELVDLVAPMPLAGLPAAAGGGIYEGMEEVGQVEAEADELAARFLDLDAMLTVRASEVLDLWVGCRGIEIEWDGQIDDDSLPDITLEGVMVGAGLRF